MPHQSARFWKPVLFLGALLIVNPGAGAQGQPAMCLAAGSAVLAEASRSVVTAFKERVEGGPFFLKMLERVGAPEKCSVTVDGENVLLSYVFRDEAHLEARTNTQIEFSEQRASFRGLSGREALSLLKKAELDSFEPNGCEIVWRRPRDEQTGDQTGLRVTDFRGATCNCRASLVRRGAVVVALLFGSAC